MDKTYIGVRAASFSPGLEGQPITGVTLLDDGGSILAQAGNSDGKVLELTDPDGTAEMAEAILRKTGSFSYRPYSAEAAMLDPAAELGDGVTVGGIYSVLAQADIRLDGAGLASISAPETNEIEDEFPYVSPQERDIQRKFQRTRSMIGKTERGILLVVRNEVQDLSSSITLLQDSITSRVEGAEKDISTLEQTAASLQSQITSATGDISTLEQTATSLESQIASATGDISTLEQTATSLQSQIHSANGAISTISQKVDNISLSVTNKTSSSKITLSVDGVEVSSQTIRFTGDVVFESDLANGTTTVSGDCITTGQISADYIKLGGAMEVYETTSSEDMGGYIGYITSWDYEGNRTHGMGIMDPDGDYQVVVTNSGARITSPSAEVVARTNITLTTNNAVNIYASRFTSDVELTTSSDRRLKEEISYDLGEKYLKLFDRLRPASFLFRGKEAKRHLGFIAQDVETALLDSGLRHDDFAALDMGDPDRYGIAYGEFVALLTAKLQQLEKKVEELKSWRS